MNFVILRNTYSLELEQKDMHTMTYSLSFPNYFASTVSSILHVLENKSGNIAIYLFVDEVGSQEYE